MPFLLYHHYNGQISPSRTPTPHVRVQLIPSRNSSSLWGGERRRDRRQQTQVEPHPRPSGRTKLKHEFQQGQALRNLFSRPPSPSPSPRKAGRSFSPRLVDKPSSNPHPNHGSSIKAAPPLPGTNGSCQRTPGPQEAAKRKLYPLPRAAGASPESQCSLSDKLEHHVLGHRSSLAVTNLQ